MFLGEQMTLSDQALSCVMVALQKSLMEQSDIVPVLKGFQFSKQEFADGSVELFVNNPPTSIALVKPE